MRGTWQLAIFGAAIAAVVLVVSGFLLFERGGKSSSASPTCQSDTSTISSGNAVISAKAPPRARANGGPFQRNVIIRPKDKRTGVPIHGAKVVIHAEMKCPHYMPLYYKKLTEVAPGEYKGPYTLVMPGDWRFGIVVRTKTGDASTTALPVRVIGQ